MNILVTSAGRRVILLKFFKQALQKNAIKGRVMAANNDPHAAAIYEADKSFLVPPVNSDNYIERLTAICKENNIDFIISLIDTELPVLAENKAKFAEIGVEAIVSEPESIEICFDKFKTAEFFKGINVPHIKTYRDKKSALTAVQEKEVSYPLLVKPARGSASKGLQKVNNAAELSNSSINKEDYIVQEFLSGQEFGIDAFVDNTGELISIFAKRKISMRAGETDKAVSLKDERLFEHTSTIAKNMKVYGPLDIDCFKMPDGSYAFSEINPRFGGGYPLAHKAGVDFMDMIVKMVRGEKLSPRIGNYQEGIYMFKYNGLQIINSNELLSY